jgi:hypothetical protein
LSGLELTVERLSDYFGGKPKLGNVKFGSSELYGKFEIAAPKLCHPSKFKSFCFEGILMN